MGAIGQARRLFETEVRKLAGDLDADQRRGLATMLMSLRALALSNAAESEHKKKWMMFAYWRVVATYAGHFARLIRRGEEA